MTTWVLLIWTAGAYSGVSFTVPNYPTAAACEVAGKQASEAFSYAWRSARYVCIPGGNQSAERAAGKGG